MRELSPRLPAYATVIRRSRDTIIKDVESLTELATRRFNNDALLILIDSDDGCPVTVAQNLSSRMRATRIDVPSGVVLAEREYESWFLAAAPSIAGVCGLRSSLAQPPNLKLRDAKGWLTEHMTKGIYKETSHQKELTRTFNIQTARENSKSFDKCYREIQRLATTLIQAA